ncbi:MAG TPA: sulfonate ABC transporter substrate-binding protein, partial [Arthrobacter sp.]|nr:sulfonate ABC transporter substrate-binding protein [Arthrobacter sp.]
MAAKQTRKKGLLLSSRTSEILLAVGLAVAIVAGAVAASSAAHRTGSAADVPVSDAQELRLGYFANVTHAPALIGVDKGFFAEEL